MGTFERWRSFLNHIKPATPTDTTSATMSAPPDVDEDDAECIVTGDYLVPKVFLVMLNHARCVPRSETTRGPLFRYVRTGHHHRQA